MATRAYDARGTKPRLLIVDDDVLVAETLTFALGADFEVLACESRAHAIELLRQLPQPPQLALVDLGLPPRPHAPDEGFLLIADLLAHASGMHIFVLSGQGDAANARHARALGATEFFAKPCDPVLLKAALLRTLAFRPAEPAGLPEQAARLIGESAALARLRGQIGQSADSPFPVLIEGESGSGKEQVALALHQLSQRAAKPYLALNCAAIAPTLVEPTLFGYVKGAFTGATANKSGYFEDAQDGTLFLDEIGELPPEIQAKLLRVLENGEYQRVGETQRRLARARVIAATNRDLRMETRQGRFRADLYHRLSVLTVAVPPLREMGRDRLLLLQHFRAQYAAQAGVAPFDFDAAAERAWLDYPFPGNVRELRNIVIRLTTKHAGKRISAGELELEFDMQSQAADAPAQHDLAAAAQHALERGGFNLDETLQEWERAYIEAALRMAQGNVSQAAKLLGVNRTTLYSRMSTAEAEGESPVLPPRERR
jgi:DNA-binding NtrC family response regulator